MTIPVQVSRQQLADACFRINKAFADSGTIIEATGHNDGPQIDRIEAVWGVQGEPYCAMGQYWAFAKAYCDLHQIPYTPQNAVDVFHSVRSNIAAEWLTFSPLVATMQAAAAMRGTWHPMTSPNSLKSAVRGDYVLYHFIINGARQNHIEQFERVDLDSNGNVTRFWTVGWNTSAAGSVGPDTNDPHQGGGCYYKHRLPDPGAVWGWIAWGRN